MPNTTLLGFILYFCVGFQSDFATDPIVRSCNEVGKQSNAKIPQQDETVRSGTVVLHAFMDGLFEKKEFDSLFSFENNELTSSGWMNELMERAMLERPDGGALREAIDSDEKLHAEVLEKYDIFLDASHGLVSNGSLSGWELGLGKGGFVDMGEVPLEEVTEAPEYAEFEDGEGYSPGLRFGGDVPPPLAKFPTLMEGHTYVVRTGSGKFAKFHVRKINKPEDELPPRYRAQSIELDWAFQSDGSRSFE